MPAWAPSDIFAEISREMEADLMEQKVHELDARLRQMKEERDQVIAENDELQVSILKSDSKWILQNWIWQFKNDS